jgi:hypothetical protein
MGTAVHIGPHSGGIPPSAANNLSAAERILGYCREENFLPDIFFLPDNFFFERAPENSAGAFFNMLQKKKLHKCLYLKKLIISLRADFIIGYLYKVKINNKLCQQFNS